MHRIGQQLVCSNTMINIQFSQKFKRLRNSEFNHLSYVLAFYIVRLFFYLLLNGMEYSDSLLIASCVTESMA